MEGEDLIRGYETKNTGGMKKRSESSEGGEKGKRERVEGEGEGEWEGNGKHRRGITRRIKGAGERGKRKAKRKERKHQKPSRRKKERREKGSNLQHLL